MCFDRGPYVTDHHRAATHERITTADQLEISLRLLASVLDLVQHRSIEASQPRQLLGHGIFDRVHVADRPAYREHVMVSYESLRPT